MNVVHVCHFMGVMHRDLKPENFLMVSKDDHSPIKAIDFSYIVCSLCCTISIILAIGIAFYYFIWFDF